MYLYFYTDIGGTPHQLLSCQYYDNFDDFVKEELPDDAEYWERKFGLTENYPYNEFKVVDIDDVDLD